MLYFRLRHSLCICIYVHFVPLSHTGTCCCYCFLHTHCLSSSFLRLCWSPTGISVCFHLPLLLQYIIRLLFLYTPSADLLCLFSQGLMLPYCCMLYFRLRHSLCICIYVHFVPLSHTGTCCCYCFLHTHCLSSSFLRLCWSPTGISVRFHLPLLLQYTILLPFLYIPSADLLY